MGNPNYIRGVRFEREILKSIRCPKQHNKDGCFAARTAGSHGRFDCFSVCFVFKTIMFVQAKTRKGEKTAPVKIFDNCGGVFDATFSTWLKEIK